MTGIKEKVENNIVVWMLGTLLAGFLAGIGTYEGALEIMNLVTVSKERLEQLESSANTNQNPPSTPGVFSVVLPDYLDSSELELLFTKIKAAYNEENYHELYQLMGPLARAQITEETGKLQMQPLFQALGEIQGGFYVNHQFIGEQGLYKYFTLNFSIKYEKAEKGILTVTVIDDGKSYQINAMFFNRI